MSNYILDKFTSATYMTKTLFEFETICRQFRYEVDQSRDKEFIEAKIFILELERDRAKEKETAKVFDLIIKKLERDISRLV